MKTQHSQQIKEYIKKANSFRKRREEFQPQTTSFSLCVAFSEWVGQPSWKVQKLNQLASAQEEKEKFELDL